MDTDQRLSITDLESRRPDASVQPWPNEIAMDLLRASPVLLEIAATGIRWAAAQAAEVASPSGDALSIASLNTTRALAAHLNALGKVRK